ALAPEIVRIIPYGLASRYDVVPIDIIEGDVLVLGMADPTNLLARDDVRAVTGRAVKPVCAPPTHIRQALATYYFYDAGPVNPLDFHRSVLGAGPSRQFLDVLTEGRRGEEPADDTTAATVTPPSTPPPAPVPVEPSLDIPA